MLVTTRDVDVQDGHERCVLLCESITGTQASPGSCVAGENIPVPLPSVQVGVLPQNIHQHIKAIDGDIVACGNTVMYLDDFFLLNESRQDLLNNRDTAIWLLTSLGFVMNIEKSVFVQSQKLEYLVF